jgi:hypothetical protein
VKKRDVALAKRRALPLRAHGMGCVGLLLRAEEGRGMVGAGALAEKLMVGGC